MATLDQQRVRTTKKLDLQMIRRAPSCRAANRTLAAAALFLVVTAYGVEREECNATVGGTFLADANTPSLELMRDGGMSLSERIAGGQKVQVAALIPGGQGGPFGSNDYYTLLTQDGRLLYISCWTFLAAMDSSHEGQHILRSEPEDFAAAKAIWKAKRAAGAKEAERKRLKREQAYAKAAQELEASLAAHRQAIAARIARGGVRIGMTRQQVLASSWGEPGRINHTFSVNGEHEQWVYDDRRFLYFVNGILVNIETDSPDDQYFRVIH